jgi:hypothetical protein
VLRLTPPDAPAWDIAVGAPNWWRAPVASWVAFLSDGAGYLADVVQRRVVHEIPRAARIAEDERHDLVLFATQRGLTAIGAAGPVWEQAGPWTDLKVERIEPDAIVGSHLTADAARREIRFDPATGSVLRAGR